MNCVFVELLLCYIHQKQSRLLKRFDLRRVTIRKKKGKSKEEEGKMLKGRQREAILRRALLDINIFFSVKHSIKLYSNNLQAPHPKLSLSDCNWLLILPLIMNVLAKLSLRKYWLCVNQKKRGLVEKADGSVQNLPDTKHFNSKNSVHIINTMANSMPVSHFHNRGAMCLCQPDTHSDMVYSLQFKLQIRRLI